MPKTFVGVEQLRFMPKRVMLAEETTATEDLRRIILELRRDNKDSPLKALIVGAGGSYPSALFARHVIANAWGTPDVGAETPQTAIRILDQFSHLKGLEYKPHYDLVIAISYSGKTPDIQRVYESCKIERIPFVLVTKAKKCDIQEMYPNYNITSDNIASYYNENDDTGNEKGMISMASTLSPIAIFDDLGEDSKRQNQQCFRIGESFAEEINIGLISKSIERIPVINVFYEWETMATAFDIESKFTESGIANVILHEKKNFSHGRYVSLYKLNSGLNINLIKQETEYGNKLNVFLEEISEMKETPYIKIGTVAFGSEQWNFEAMSKLPYFLVAIGEQLGIDISKPLQPFPDEPKEIYNYTGEF